MNATDAPGADADGLNTERIDAYAALLSAGHMLSRAVLALQFANADPSGEHRQQALDELYRANELYIQAYTKVAPPTPASEAA